MDQAKVATGTVEIASEGRRKVERPVADVQNDSRQSKIRKCRQIESNKEEWAFVVNDVKVLRASYSQGISK
jgi:hypothetical protein